MTEVVRAADCVQFGYCLSGSRKFCKLHDINFRRFVSEGIPIPELSHLMEDSRIKTLVEYVSNGRTK